MAAAAGQVAAIIARIAIGLIQKEQADQAAEERQTQIMDALNKIQGTLQTIQYADRKTTDLVDKTITSEEIQNEVEQITSQFPANVDQVFETAYQQFPAFVKEFKLNYQDEGSNLTNWFRMWRNNTHVKNYTPIAGDPHMINPFNQFPNSLALAQAYEVYPTPCDDAEGIYPEVEF
ncbi:hypothetical protein FVEG_05754 [Fusarium verticillioides 7600]|uniref:Uncharacterized protein n=1 Tax=Gibberella moniliformis (strain M3125 / FGSC 7600) TaxID=334819 RepID=W7LZM5_GIBM7|nr:hypothetical protein FVEG_05754 [Fusarium verticillioides 7600]EWG44763.1 hypothetical protein FVEG_05754 [Fusarium verticillioides 7600]